MNKIETGSILRFRLDHHLGYGYCRIIDFTTSETLTTVVVKVYNIYGEGEHSVDEIINADYLLNPIRIYEYPNLKGKGSWKLIGKAPMDEDKVIPVFKAAPARALSQLVKENDCERWRPMYNFYDYGDYCDFKQLGHLERQHLYYKDTIIRRATMEVIKLAEQNIEDYYDIEDTLYCWDYIRSINTPFLRNIPKKYRGQLISMEDLKTIKGIPFRTLRANPEPAIVFDGTQKRFLGI